MSHFLPRTIALFLALYFGCASIAVAQRPSVKPEPPKTKRKDDSQQREQSLRKLAAKLHVGPGSAIADIGAGSGRDSWIFADIVGPDGKVYAEEISQDSVGKIETAAKDKGLNQVQAVLGTDTAPSLPASSVDLAFMHYVYHHFSKPREMLRGIWSGLKPGGKLVIVDRRKGTLVDWVPREDRAAKHFWIAETTVVREAREEGFLFAGPGEDVWHTQDDTFVLVLQRPEAATAAGCDPDPLPPIPASAISELAPAAGERWQRVALVALGEGRKLIAPLLAATSAQATEIVLEEWATRKDERPASPEGLQLPAVLTDNGDPQLGPEMLDAVCFLDTYHLLFHGETLLPKLRERLNSSGKVFVLDRASAEPIPHREASHRRRIHPETVKSEMAAAGFSLAREIDYSAEGRFLLVFSKQQP